MLSIFVSHPEIYSESVCVGRRNAFLAPQGFLWPGRKNVSVQNGLVVDFTLGGDIKEGCKKSRLLGEFYSIHNNYGDTKQTS